MPVSHPTRPRRARWAARLLTAGAAVLAIPTAAAVAAPDIVLAAPVFAPVHRTPAGGFEELLVPSSMGPVKVQVQWARNGGGSALYLLDGLRARDDQNAWVIDTNARQQFENDDVTLVMPVGGQSSWYADWVSPSNTNGQKFTYKWETFLTRELPDFLAGYGVSRTNNAVVGLSMSGPAALRLAAFYPQQFKHASSFSGPLNLTAPGMPEAMRVMMLSAGQYNRDSLAPPWSPTWLRMDPFVFAPQLRNVPMYISAATGLPAQYDHPTSAGGVIDTFDAMWIESLAMVGTRALQARLNALNIPAVYDFPIAGTHSWKYWEAELWKARPYILNALNA
ncbi:alpha/beta hydrolase family protein [Nocardia sp. CDC153]|uniref:alpha/beta hydrolase n=1 Tax=Nocardia sp. CDC153 TaxID=3112167 RepID=UPI002DB6C61B|nr:alpha/beta hydrolase family protein [Nocardia sp. CDC153]MEC3953643.1 alpha/beta hydrolase family protein [Nocardia sp. CDC153]